MNSPSANGGTLHKWINANPERKRIYAQECLIVIVAERISLLMQRQNMSKADLAAKLGCSKAHVTGLLSGSRNMTLRTIADIAGVLGCRVEFILTTRKKR